MLPTLDTDRQAAWLLLAPALILLSIFVFWPITYLGYLSFTSGSFTRAGIHWVSLSNYRRLLGDADFWQVMGNTVYFTLATVVPSVVLPLGLAALLNRSITLPSAICSIDIRGPLRTAYFIPSVASLVAAGLGFRWLFQNDGPINGLLTGMGGPSIPWLNSPNWAMPVLIILSIWKQIGFNMVVFLAGLQAIPRTRYEAAELDGAGPWQQFRYITLPGLQPTLVFVIVTTVIFTLRSFEPVYVMTGGEPLNTTNILVYYIYEQAFSQFDFGYAAAAATVLMFIALGLVYVQLRIWQQGD
ncbi:MAG: sugar ABC transporter permease [Cyanobacteria bacterium P01_F01_bin.4]